MSSDCPEGAEVVASHLARISFAALFLAWAGAAAAPVAAPLAAQAQDRDRAAAPVLREPGPDLGRCTVERIVDGDTFVCEGGERVRMILINAPEMSDAPLGELARDELVRILPLGTAVRLEGDVSERDRYGRILAYVHTPDGRMVNRLLARRGYAQVMVVPPDVRHVELVAAARDSARTEGAGLWDPAQGFGSGAPDGFVPDR